jgi:hypothetical protein
MGGIRPIESRERERGSRIALGNRCIEQSRIAFNNGEHEAARERSAGEPGEVVAIECDEPVELRRRRALNTLCRLDAAHRVRGLSEQDDQSNAAARKQHERRKHLDERYTAASTAHAPFVP